MKKKKERVDGRGYGAWGKKMWVLSWGGRLMLDPERAYHGGAQEKSRKEGGLREVTPGRSTFWAQVVE